MQIVIQLAGNKKRTAEDDRKAEANLVTDQESSSTRSSVSSKLIQGIVEHLRCQFLRDSTKQNYYNVWRTFNKLNLKLDKMPASWEERLTLFIGYHIALNR